MKGHFNNALNNLQNMLESMALYAEEAVRLSGKAVDEVSISTASQVIAGDEKIDGMEIQIEEECLKILALHQPVASDLRQVITILKVNNELERIGDLAVNMAERVGSLDSYKESNVEKIEFGEMLHISCDMLKDALRSLVNHNIVLAQDVIERDEKVDKIHRENYAIVKEFMLKYPECAQYYLNGLTISRCLERIADSATNIAEDVIYLESGKIVRHCHETDKNK